MNNICLVSTDDLLKELLHRFDHAVFAGIQVKGTAGIAPYDIFRRWYGNSLTCSGLCASLSKSILQDFSERETELPEG